MAVTSVSLTPVRPNSLFRLRRLHHHHQRYQAPPHLLNVFVTFPSVQASRRSSSQQSDELMNDSPKWARLDFDGYEDDEDDEEYEEEDRSLDLLIRFVENIFKKVSKRARKAVRSVLPIAISTKLVGFAVNGLIILSFLWVLKAFLEVICTLGSVVFVSILLIRGVWSGVLYLQEGRSRYMNGIDDDDQPSWTRTQPIT